MEPHKPEPGSEETPSQVSRGVPTHVNCRLLARTKGNFSYEHALSNWIIHADITAVCRVMSVLVAKRKQKVTALSTVTDHTKVVRSEQQSTFK